MGEKCQCFGSDGCHPRHHLALFLGWHPAAVGGIATLFAAATVSSANSMKCCFGFAGATTAIRRQLWYAAAVLIWRKRRRWPLHALQTSPSVCLQTDDMPLIYLYRSWSKNMVVYINLCDLARDTRHTINDFRRRTRATRGGPTTVSAVKKTTKMNVNIDFSSVSEAHQLSTVIHFSH